MTKTKYIDHLYDLLVNHKFIGYRDEEKNYRDAMYRLLFCSDSKRQKSIRSTLAEEGIILRDDCELDTFLFYLSYYTIIKTDRDFLHGKSDNGLQKDENPDDYLLCLSYCTFNKTDKDSDIQSSEFPNQDLGYHLKKKDRSLWWIGIQFLLLYDTYMKIIQEYEKEEDIKNEFCRQIRFSHQHIENASCNEALFKNLMKVGTIYDTAFIDRYNDELMSRANIERELFVQLLGEYIDGFVKRAIYCFKLYFINAISLKKNDECEKITDDIDGIFFDLFFCGKFCKRLYDLINLDYIEVSNENKKLLEDVKFVLKNNMETLKEYLSLYIKQMQKNTFLIVGSYLVIFDELREHNAQIDQLEILREKISKGCVHKEAKEGIWEYDYVNYDLDSIPVNDILDYFIPNVKERKTSDRNTIKTRIKTIREVLRYIIICPDFDDIREIKMLYREFYIERNELLGSLKYPTFLRMLEEQDETKIDCLDTIRLKELYIALKYLSNDKKREYLQYNMQKQEYLKGFMKEIFIDPFGIPEKNRSDIVST